MKSPADAPPPKIARQINADWRKQGLVMQIAGERIKRTRLIQTEKYVVAVAVEMVIPPDDPSEPCYEAETVKWLREVKERAERGEVAWLKRHGKVYTAVGAADHSDVA